MSESTITFLILAVTVAVFVWDQFPVAVVAMGVALSLWATGVLELEQSLAGFGDPTVIFIASLFVVSEALDSTGVTAWAGQALIARAGDSRTRLIVLTMLLVALLTALISVNGAVAALLPVVAVIAVRLRMSPSQLLLPLAFGAHAGSMVALTGSPVNVIVSEFADDAGEGRFGFFEFALVGLPLLAGTIAIVVFFGERLLPDRKARSATRDFGTLARTLVEQYDLDHEPELLFSRASGVAEVVVPPRSALIGETVFPGMVTDSGDLVVLAVQRNGEDLTGETELVLGDTLLLRGAWGDLEYHLDDPDLLVVDEPALVRRQTVPLGPGAKRTLVVLAGMVVLLVAGLVPPAVAGLFAAGAIVLLGVLTAEQAYRGISWTTVILVAGMIPLSTAMVESGAAEELAEALVSGIGDAGPYALLLGLVVLTMGLGQLISNTATALIVIPIAVSAAGELDVSAKPLLMGVCVAASASFLTPVATPANLMVMSPGGYRFGDYWKLGLPLLAAVRDRRRAPRPCDLVVLRAARVVRSRRGRRLAGQGLFLVVSLVSLYVLLPSVLEVFTSWRELFELDPVWVAIAFSFEALSFFAVWELQRIALHAPHRLPVSLSQLAGNALSKVIPGGAAAAGALQYRMLTRVGIPRGRIASALTGVSALLFGTVLALPLLSLPAILAGAPVDPGLAQAAFLGVSLFVIMVAAGVAAFAYDRPLRVVGRLTALGLNRTVRRHAHVVDLPERLLHERDSLLAAFGRQWKSAVLAAASRSMLDYLALLACLRAVGAEPEPTLVLLAYVAAAFLGMIPLTPGGLGFVEAGLTGMLALAGVAGAAAAVATLAYRLISFWLPIPAGGLAYAAFWRRYPVSRAGGVD